MLSICLISPSVADYEFYFMLLSTTEAQNGDTLLIVHQLTVHKTKYFLEIKTLH